MFFLLFLYLELEESYSTLVSKAVELHKQHLNSYKPNISMRLRSVLLVIITRRISQDSIVMLVWLARFNTAEHNSVFEDQAEQRVLYDLEAVLEGSVSETFENDYELILSKARNKIRDKE